MTLLEAWVGTPLAEAIGWTLLHSLWQGAIVAAALGALLAALRSSRVRYAVACAALIAIAGAFVVTLLRIMPELTGVPEYARTWAFHEWMIRPDTTAAHPWSRGLAAAVPWLAPIWVAGVWISCLWHATGLLSVRRLRRRGVCCPPEYWQKHLARLSAQLRLSRPVQLIESSLVNVPMVLGHMRPLILVPAGLLTQMPAEQIEAILLHELAHIRRKDYLFNALQRVVEGLLFYHPAVWWISSVIRAERENCCDDVVVATSGNAYGYAAALAALEESRWPGRKPAVAASGGNLVKRIHRLLYPRPNASWTPVLAAAVLMASGAVALVAWQATPSAQLAAAAQVQTSGDTTPYLRWLNQDVSYLISDEERAAFQKLTTDQEREKFVEQFWLRRDPTPNTTENEFKVEHYRRIKSANERFATAAGRLGWQTDRGHIYVVYGPPDEIESHPGGAQGPSGFEVWKYTHVDGIGDNLFISFIRRTQNGDYQIAPGNPHYPSDSR